MPAIAPTSTSGLSQPRTLDRARAAVATGFGVPSRLYGMMPVITADIAM